MATYKEQNKLNVPHLRFPEFHGEWEKCKLGDIATLTKGSGISKDQRSATGAPCILYGELYTTYKSEVIDYVVSKTDISDKNLVRSCANDIIIPSSGETAIDISTARCVLFPDVLLGGDLNIIRLKDGDGRFFSYQLNGVRKHDIAKIAQGVSVVHLYGESIKGLTVSFPSNKEQQKISTLLSLIDERIATQSKLIEDLKKLKSAIIDYAIDSLDADFVKFGSLYETAGEGGTPTTSNAQFYEDGKIPFIKIDDLKKKYLTENKDFITELGLQKSSAWLVPSRSILFSNGATIGEITITTYPVCTKQGILGIVPKPNIDVEFLYYFMSSSYFKKAVSRIVTEGTMKTAYLKDINNIRCPIPIKEKQQDIAKMPSALNSKIDFEQSILKLFGSQKQYLLRQMFM
ncbi:MAG: restriction endonuclease subunit S [Prevotella sp.]|nr:restriction endonuclease subunit S [Prevotella sp.]